MCKLFDLFSVCLWRAAADHWKEDFIQNSTGYVFQHPAGQYLAASKQETGGGGNK